MVGIGLLNIAALGDPGALDPTFNAGKGAQGDSANSPAVWASALQADGKILLGGRFSSFNDFPATNIVRLNRDGSIDPTFSSALSGTVTAIKIAPDGSILVGGYGASVTTNSSMARLLPDGRIDPSFNVHLSGYYNRGGGDSLLTGRTVADILILPNGRIAITGSFTNVNSTNLTGIAILKSDGTLDPAFFRNGGLDDIGFGNTLAPQFDGKILVGGRFNLAGSQTRKNVARFNPDGTLDETFNPTFLNPSVQGGDVYSILVTDDGILVAGAFSRVNGESRVALARMKPDGSLDLGFNLPFEAMGWFSPIVMSLDVEPDGTFVVAGYMKLLENGVTYRQIMRLTPDGNLDRSFFADPKTSLQDLRATAQADGAIIVTGYFYFSEYSTSTPSGVVRLQAGEVTLPRITQQLSSPTQPTGSRIVFSATVIGAVPLSYQWYFNGEPIPGGTNSTYVIESLLPNQGGKYTFTAENRFGRVTSDPATLTVGQPPAVPGSIDASFDPQLDGPVTQLTLDTDGRIIIVGQFTKIGGTSVNGFARLESSGALDPTFSPAVDGSAIAAMTGIAGHRLLLATGRPDYPPSSLVTLSAGGAVEATFDLGKLLQSDGFDVERRPASTGLFVLSDGTPVLQQVGWAEPSTSKLTSYAISSDGTALTATATNFPFYPAAPRQALGQALVSYGEILHGLRPANAFVLLRRDDGGAIDRTFRTVLDQTVINPIIAVQPDDYFISAPFRYLYPVPGVIQPDTALKRFRPDGTFDANFSETVLLPNGLNYNYPRGPVSAIAIESNRTALVAGWFPSVSTASRGYLIRINLGEFRPPAKPRLLESPESHDVLVGQADTLRANFDATGPLQIQWSCNDESLPGRTNLILTLTNISQAQEGEYSVEVTNAAGSVRSDRAMITVVPAPAGSVDPAFSPGSAADDGQVNALLLEPDGRILVGGTFTKFDGAPAMGLVRLNADGSRDSSFEAGRGRPGGPLISKLAVDLLARQSDGRICVSGSYLEAPSTVRTGLFRLFPDGALDADFRAGSIASVYSLVALPNDELLVGGTFNYPNPSAPSDVFRNWIRFNKDGVLNPNFRPDMSAPQVRVFSPGSVRAMEIVEDRTVLVAGIFNPKGIGSSFARFSLDGSRDGSFQPRLYTGFSDSGDGGYADIQAMARSSDGESAVFGNYTAAGASSGVSRFTSDGHLIGLNAVVHGVNRLAFQADGKLLVGGAFDTISGIARSNLARLHRDGSVDLSFGKSGGGPNDAVLSIVVEPSGSILIGGKFSSVDGVARRGVARLYGSGKVYRQLLRPRSESGVFSATVQTLAGKRYSLERSESLDPATWTTAATFDGDGNVKAITDDQANRRQRYYRLRIE